MCVWICIGSNLRYGIYIRSSKFNDKGTRNFEGAPCVDHKIQNDVKHASRGSFITHLEKSCRGMVAYFKRNSNVIYLLLTRITRHDINLTFSSTRLNRDTGSQGLAAVVRVRVQAILRMRCVGLDFPRPIRSRTNPVPSY